MKRTIPLNKGVEVTLNASGAGRAELGPSYYGTEWRVTRAVVKVTPAVSIPVCSLYAGSPSPNTLVGESGTGSQDTDSVLNVTLYPGQKITAVWSGGDAGATAILSIYGEQIIEGG